MSRFYRLGRGFESCQGHVIDVTGKEVSVGDHVGIAFSFSQASVGYIKLGVIETLNPLTVKWDVTGKVSPKMVYNEKRIVILQ